MHLNMNRSSRRAVLAAATGVLVLAALTTLNLVMPLAYADRSALDAEADVRKLLDPAQADSWGHALNSAPPANLPAGAATMAAKYHNNATLLPTVKPGLWKKNVNPKIEDYFKGVFLKKRPTLCGDNLAESHVVIMGNYASNQGLYTFELDKAAGVLPREKVRARYTFVYVKEEGTEWSTATILQHHSSVEPEIAGCVADVDHNAHVNIDDLVAVVNTFGACPAALATCCPTDVNGDRQVNVDDLTGVINSWGPCAPP